jgi:hypothetical protein
MQNTSRLTRKKRKIECKTQTFVGGQKKAASHRVQKKKEKAMAGFETEEAFFCD